METWATTHRVYDRAVIKANNLDFRDIAANAREKMRLTGPADENRRAALPAPRKRPRADDDVETKSPRPQSRGRGGPARGGQSRRNRLLHATHAALLEEHNYNGKDKEE